MKFEAPKRTVLPSKKEPRVFIDIRAEMEELFYGNSYTPGHAFEAIIRRVDKTQRCYCWDPLKEEAKDRCKKCSGSGWNTTNIIVDTVKKKYVGKELWTDVGQMESDTSMFYFLHNIRLTEEDSILEVVTNDDGKIPDRNNFTIIKTFSIRDFEIYRANNGRREFSRAYCSKSE